MKRVEYTDEQRRALFDRMQADVKNGMPINAAARAAGVSPTNYYNWSRMFGKKPRSQKKKSAAPELLPLPQHAPGLQRVFVLFGNADDVAETVKRLA